MAAADYTSLVQQIYISYFGRPADTLGLANYAAQLDALKAPTTLADLLVSAKSNASLSTLINSFGTSAESVALYGTDTIAFVGAIYTNVLNRPADYDGLLYWAGEINAGRLSKAAAALNIAQGALSNTSEQGLLDAATLTAKTTIATNFTAAIDTAAELSAYAGNAAAASARDLLKTVTATTDATAFQANVDTAIAALVTAANPPAASQSLTLTGGEDSGAAFTGNAAVTKFEAPVLNVNGNLIQTLQSVDSLNGGAGEDTLNVTTFDYNGSQDIATPTLVSVENVNVRNTSAGFGISLAGATGVNKVTVAGSTANTNINGVGSIASFAVADQKEDVSFNDGTATTVAVSAKNVGTVSATAGVQAVVNLDDNNVLVANLTVENSNIELNNAGSGNNSLKTVSIAATGDNQVNLNAGATTIESLTVTGAGSVDLTDINLSALKTVTAADGGVALVSTSATANTLVLTSGAGADDVTVVGVNVKTLSVGGGNDSVATTGDATANAAVTTANAALTAATTAAGTAHTAAVAAASTLTAAQGQVVTATAAVNAATTALNAAGTQLATANAALAIDTVTQTNATTVATATAATLATSITAAGTAATAATAAAGVYSAALATQAADIATATTANTAWANAVTAASTALAAKTAAIAVDAALTTMTTAIQNVATDTQPENDAATAAAVLAGALTDQQRTQINVAYATGLLTDAATAQSLAAVAYASVVSAASANVTSTTTASNTANTAVTTTLGAKTAADLAVTADLTTVSNALTAKNTADTNKASADSLVTTNTTVDTAAQAAKTAADAAVAADVAAATAATTAQTTAAGQLATANTALTTAGTAVTTASTAKTAADAADATAATLVTTKTADVATAVAAAMDMGAIAATATVNLGAGNDTLVLSNGFKAGATITGGDGTDTLKITGADYVTVSGYTAEKLALVTGFETLNLSTALTTGTYDASKIAGITSVTANAGVAAANAAIISNLAANSTVTLAGALDTNTGSLTVNFKTDTSADVLNLVLNSNYNDNNNTSIDAVARAETVVAQLIETVNVKSTGHINTFTAIEGYKADLVTNTLSLTDNALVTLNVTGDAALTFASSAAQTKLVTINAAANTGGLNFDGHLADTTNGAAMTITGSATAANSLTGTDLADTITGGAGNDIINGGAGRDVISAGAGKDTVNGGAGADTITLGAGNDVYVLNVASDSVLAAFDTITDFTANTKGQGSSASAISMGATLVAADLTGDRIDIHSMLNASGIKVLVVANAADAQTFIQNTGNTSTLAGFSLDSTSGKLYMDFNSDGIIDSVVALTGVTTITEAAFVTGLNNA